ncbi:MAG: DUF4190 domain-containing protein [Lachnospiraceae bacterium]|nr:DUF4190 domain-containing protein [Lachnospiraceae bacterium]
MSMVSLILGICSIVLICCGLSMPLGALGIIFAILSRGAGKMDGMSKVGLGLSIGGIVTFFIAMIFYVVVMVSSGLMSHAMSMSQQYDFSDPSDVQEFIYDWEDYMYQNPDSFK